MVNKRYKWEPRAWLAHKGYFGLLQGKDIWEHPTTPREEAELIVAKWQHQFVGQIRESNVFRRLTTDELGAIIGVGASTFERILNGSRPLELTEYVMLCKEFDFPLEIMDETQK